MIRLARSDEAAALSEVIAASITGLCSADHHDDPTRIRPWVATRSPMAMATMLADPEQRLFVAAPGEEITAVGGLDWRQQPDDQGRISLLFVTPEARGKGVSSALLAAMEDDLRRMGRREGRLTATNTALHFYRRHGWQTDDRAGGGGFLLGHQMRKRLV